MLKKREGFNSIPLGDKFIIYNDSNDNYLVVNKAAFEIINSEYIDGKFKNESLIKELIEKNILEEA